MGDFVTIFFIVQLRLMNGKLRAVTGNQVIITCSLAINLQIVRNVAKYLLLDFYSIQLASTRQIFATNI